jgi:hypothetical protein
MLYWPDVFEGVFQQVGEANACRKVFVACGEVRGHRSLAHSA